MARIRADVRLVELGLASSRERAQALILAGKVYLNESRVEKAGQPIDSEARLSLKGSPLRYVSRGGIKLEGALNALSIDPSGWTVADFGASTGGFTDCLLQHGASRVYAIDVGYGQLAHSVRTDPRVIVLERCNARYLRAEDLPEPLDAVVIDVSFISLTKILDAATAVLKRSGQILAMVKPQFEVGKHRVGKGGVVRDPQIRMHAIDAVAQCATRLGLTEIGRADAPIKGPKGNHEAFLHLCAE